jgi:hypothetical protein
MLVMSMTEATLRFARGAQRGDAHAVWTNLHAEFERNTRANKLNLRKQLYECCGDKHLSLSDLVNKIDVLSSRLEFLGEEVRDKEKLAVLLCAASRNFDPVVAILELSDETTPILYSFAVEKLKDFDTRSSGRHRERTHDTNGGRALAVRAPPQLSEVVCYNCQSKGHYARNCPVLQDKAIQQVQADVVRRQSQSW